MTTEIARTLIQVDSKQVVGATRAVDKLGDKAIKSERQAGKLTKRFREMAKTSFASKLSIAALGVAIVGFSKAVIDANSIMEDYNLRIKILLGTQAESTELFQDMTKFAAEVPFAFQEIMGAATQLTGVLKGGGDEVTSLMPLIADLAAVSGLGIQTTTEQIIRMFSAGAASADLFRERGITAMLGFQAGVSVSADETRRRVIEAWEMTGSKFKGATEAMKDTWTGQVSIMGDAWFTFKNNVADTDDALAGIQIITTALKFWGAFLKPLTELEKEELKIVQFRALASDVAARGLIQEAVGFLDQAAAIEKKIGADKKELEQLKLNRAFQAEFEEEEKARRKAKEESLKSFLEVKKELRDTDAEEARIRRDSDLRDELEAMKKRVAAERTANATIKTMREQNQNAMIALAKQAAGGNKTALLAILGAETALSIARITAATQANAALFPPAAPAILAQGALARTLVLGAAAVGAAGILGQAHDGLADVPKTGTFMLAKGERVVKPADNKLLTKALESGQLGGAPMIVVNVDATGSATVEDVVERAAQRGAEKGYELVAEDMRRGGPIRTVIR